MNKEGEGWELYKPEVKQAASSAPADTDGTILSDELTC